MEQSLVKENLVIEKSFELGVSAKQLPPESESLNREYYNLGLKLFHAHKEIHRQSNLIDFINSEKNSLWEDEPSFKDFRNCVVLSSTSLLEMNKQYKVYSDFKNKFSIEYPELLTILGNHIMFDFSYEICRELIVEKILKKKEEFNKAYGNLFETLRSISNKK